MVARAAIILAAGQGTRMKSALPKVMHPVGGRPMIDWSIALAKAAGCERIVVVTSPQQEDLRAHVVARLGDGATAIQSEPLGTGHAARAAEAALSGFSGDVVVMFGDSPLMPVDALNALFAALGEGADIGVLGFEAADPGMYGRLIVEDGDLQAIVEARDASPGHLAITLCNSGVMTGRAETMFKLLAKVKNDNAKGEYYLTDLVALARADGGTCKAVVAREADLIGCDSRADLAQAEATFQDTMRTRALESGVTLIAPDTVYFSYDTEIEPDVVIEPNVVFGPGVKVRSGARIRAFSHLDGAVVAGGCEVGPYARLRPGSVLEAGARVGNFVELKNTTMKAGAKANHLAYLGDGDIGTGANIGAGTIFCNYDGFLKYRTVIGENAFVGSNSAIVAPVTIGEGAYVGSGSVITKDVAPGALAVARGRQTGKEGWALSFRTRMTALKAERSKT